MNVVHQLQCDINQFQMCFAKCNLCKNSINPKYNEDGTVNDETNNELVIPEGVHEHVDNVDINISLEDGIVAFIYETKDVFVVVWTSHEAAELYHNTLPNY